jgi:hypothetical protein
MRKLLIILGLCLSLVGYSQIPSSFGAISSSGGSSSIYTDEFQAVLDDWTTDPTGDTLTWYNAFVDSLVTNGYWDRADGMWYFATTSNGDSEALVNWISPGTHDATAVSSPTWTKREGYTGDGTADYINLNYNVDTDSSNVGRNDMTVFVYARANPNDTYLFGSEEGAVSCKLSGRYNGPNTMRTYINNGTALANANASAAGMSTMTRRGATDTEQYFDGSSLGSDASTSQDTPAYDYYVLAVNDDGTADEFSSNQVSFVLIMDGCTDAEVTEIYGWFQTLMTNIGSEV